MILKIRDKLVNLDDFDGAYIDEVKPDRWDTHMYNTLNFTDTAIADLTEYYLVIKKKNRKWYQSDTTIKLDSKLEGQIWLDTITNTLNK